MTEERSAELEVMAAMFFNPGELEILQDSPTQGDVTVRLELSVGEGKSLSLVAVLPGGYPEDAPAFSITSAALTRSAESRMTRDLEDHIRANCAGQVALFNATEWISQNFTAYCAADEVSKEEMALEMPAHPGKHTRIWLYFIGFYTPSIRKDFVSRAAEESIHGFLMTGKPGLAVLEGPEDLCQRFLSIIRTEVFATVHRSNRKMNVTLIESLASPEEYKFSGFEHLDFTGGHSGNDSIVDLELLKRYLDQRGLIHVFKHVFSDCMS